MTCEYTAGNIRDVVVRDHKEISARLLSPLLEDKMVMLRVKDQKLPKKKRMDKYYLFLIPSVLLGLPRGAIMASIPGLGCEIFKFEINIKTIVFLRLGLNPVLARALSSAITNLFILGETNGCET